MDNADWTKQGIVFYGGSRDGELAAVFPARLASMNCEQTIEGEGFVELYERTDRAHDGNTVFRFAGRRRDLEDD